MALQKYSNTNLASCILLASAWASATTLIVDTGKWWLFPASNFRVKFYVLDSEERIIKQEIIYVDSRTGDSFINCTRWADDCPADYTATAQTNTQFAYDTSQETVYVQQVFPNAQIEDIQNEVEDIVVTKLPLKANDADVVHKTWAESISWVKTFTSKPQVPTGTTGLDAVNKAQLDAEVLAAWAVEALVDKDTYILWEDVVAGDSLFVEDMVDYNDSVIDYASWFLELDSTSTNQWAGYRILSNAVQTIVTVTKINSCTATRAVLRNDAWTILDTATFSWNVATFSSPYELSDWVQYRVHLDSNWWNYSRRRGLIIAFPAYDFIEYVWWSRDTSTNDVSPYNITSIGIIYIQNIGDVTANTRVSIPALWSGVTASTLKLALKKFVSPWVDLWIRIETDNAGEPSGTLVDANATATVTAASLTTGLVDTTVTLAGSITVAEWTRVHIVLYAWIYWSETVNGTNYFGIGYVPKNTTTRPLNTYNWSIYGTADNDIFSYVDSDLFTPKLLSKTNATYSYKLPNDLPRIATEAKSSWENVVATILGLNDNFSGLTPLATYYISDTPWVIGAVSWTYIYKVWEAVDDVTINISKTAIIRKSTFTTINSSRVSWGWSGTTTSSIYQSDANYRVVFSLNAYAPTSQETYLRIQESDDGSTWRITINRQNAEDSEEMNSSMEVFLLKGKYYRTQIEATSGGGYWSITMLSNILFS